MKTSELIGPALNWAVAKCEGWDAPICKNPTWAVPIYIATNDTRLHTYAPSTDWAQGGPIIEREEIASYPMPIEVGDAWRAEQYGRYLQAGPAPLIAAMRCYVASKLGDEVEVPDELV